MGYEIFYKTFILGKFTDRRYRLDYKYVIQRYFMKIIGTDPEVYMGGGGGVLSDHPGDLE